MKIKLLALSVAAMSMLTACGGDDDKNDAAVDTNTDTPTVATDTPAAAAALPKLTRLATTPVGAELTGMFLTDANDFFFNIQHPSTSLPGQEGKAAVGAWVGVDVEAIDGDFEELAVPAVGSAEGETTMVASGDYQVLGREDDTYAGDLPFGLGAIVNGAQDAEIKQSNDPDFNAFVATNDDASEGFLFTAWEDRPGAMSRIQLKKMDNGAWSSEGALNIDFLDVKGTMINCFGTLSPWETPLTSEENYEAENTATWNNSAKEGGYPSYADVQNIQTYLGGTFPNPYDYGYIVEITQPTAAAPVPVKHFTLGRMAHENPVIMPDNKTVYLTDDGGNKAFYKFVATTAGDLSAGTLYAAKLTQDAGVTDSAEAGFDITWIALGTANNTEIESWIDEYDGIDETDYVSGGNNYISDADITAYGNDTAADDRVAFLESLRAAKAKGATAEFNKMEGININYDAAADGSVPFMYVAMSDVAGGMADGSGDIAVTANRCGIVYRFPLESDFNVLRMEPAIAGGAYDSTAAANQCDVNGISNPDNIVVLANGNVLIGEDTGRHENNMLWLFNPDAE